MAGQKRQSPFRLLGNRLKLIRENHHESVAEVSGAVEIDADMLERIESGEERPSEDVLMLLINHFSLHEHEAVQLWESAGYSQDKDTKQILSEIQSKSTVVLVAIDARVLYSDGATLSANQSGIVMNFTQSGSAPQPIPIARIGMSYEQAAAVLRVLEQAMLRKRYLPRYRLLPPGAK